ncbi:TetR/AcrR family transcriptional regulator [Agromyces laixinhei]|uniref:TetR/AcrR family transcriptional regulator n=1 Tax=Agromyces laixinhei TaxID=2585717 RepID=UPI0011161A3D|nr:TetR/AcrR family transcriptional regulator [Agromyces laixinhei]
MTGRPRSTDVDRRLESAALMLFARGGLSAVSFDAVARQAGVSRTAIYRRWDTREALVAASLRAFRAAAESGLEDWTDRTLDAILDIFVDRAAAALDDAFARNLLRHLVALGPDGEAITHTYLAEMIVPRREAFSAKIREAQARGQIEPTRDPDLMQDLLAGALIQRLLLWGDLASGTDPRDYVEAVLEAVGFPRRPGSRARE